MFDARKNLPGALPLGEPPSGDVVFPIVGIGASAGGLEAFTQLLEHLPTTTGMASIFVQHLDPSSPSILPELLAQMTNMPLHAAQEQMSLPVACNLRKQRRHKRTQIKSAQDRSYVICSPMP